MKKFSSTIIKITEKMKSWENFIKKHVRKICKSKIYEEDLEIMKQPIDGTSATDKKTRNMCQQL